LSIMVDHTYLSQEVRESLLDLVDGDGESLAELIDTLLESNPTLISELKEGVATQQADQIREAAHALKSSNAQMGATTFAERCQEMENYGKFEQVNQAADLLGDLLDESEKTSQALKAWKVQLMVGVN
ncbi:MAG: Hpt domain-containing protein, partial [Bacteroidota bacterium]